MRSIYIEENMCTIYKLEIHRLHNYLIANNVDITSEIHKADEFVIGVCAAFCADEARSITMIEKICSTLMTHKPVHIFGCMTKVNPAKINETFRLFTKKCGMFASWELDMLAKNIIPTPKVPWEDIQLPSKFRQMADYRIYNPLKQFVGISTGCSFECTYCPHKIGVGDIISRSPQDILEQIQRLRATGIKTIVLTGTDTACYGKDIGLSFTHLLEQIISSVKDVEIHIAQFNPEGLFYESEKLICICQSKIITDFQLPIQTTSSRLLSLMNRKYAPDTIASFIQKTRQDNPNILFRTDLIVGFPTETDAELDYSLEFAAKTFDEIAVYGFELKTNTPLAMLELPLFSQAEIEQRRLKATNFFKSRGLLVHSGGQLISTLYESNIAKEKNRRI